MSAYQDRGKVFRVAWVCAAAIVVVAGLAMVVFPGPAVIVIPIGLLMLSLEFALGPASTRQGTRRWAGSR